MLSRLFQTISDFLATAQFSCAEVDSQREEISTALDDIMDMVSGVFTFTSSYKF